MQDEKVAQNVDSLENSAELKEKCPFSLSFKEVFMPYVYMQYIFAAKKFIKFFNQF